MDKGQSQNLKQSRLKPAHKNDIDNQDPFEDPVSSHIHHNPAIHNNTSPSASKCEITETQTTPIKMYQTVKRQQPIKRY